MSSGLIIVQQATLKVLDQCFSKGVGSWQHSSKGVFLVSFFYHGVVKKLTTLASLSSSLNVYGCWWMWWLQIWSDCGIFGCLRFELLPLVTCDDYLVPLEQLLELLFPFRASTACSTICSKNAWLVGPLVHLHFAGWGSWYLICMLLRVHERLFSQQRMVTLNEFAILTLVLNFAAQYPLMVTSFDSYI